MPDVFFLPVEGDDALQIKHVDSIDLHGDWVVLDIENGDHVAIFVPGNFLGYRVAYGEDSGGGGRSNPMPDDVVEDDKALKFRMH